MGIDTTGVDTTNGGAQQWLAHNNISPASASLLGTDTELPQFRSARESLGLAAIPGTLIAQGYEGDDAYDPFSDYSEFEESAEEEEDVHFFRNGRLFTVALIVGYRGWTSTLASIYTDNPNFGLSLTYFFNLRFSLQFGFLAGSHWLQVQGPNEFVQGNISFADVAFNLKYYFNTQNVTRGLANLNPYAFTGVSQLMRTIVIDTAPDEVAKDSSFAFNVGAGIEIPIMRNKMYFGAQAGYTLTAFPDEGRYIKESDATTRVVKPDGDSFTVLGMLGSNF